MAYKVTGLATLSDHKAAERALKEREPKRERKTLYVVNAPVSAKASGLELPCPYLLPTFNTREEARDFRREQGFEGYSITELAWEKRG